MDFKKELYSRFERYVKINTQSKEESKTCPSTPGQLKLAKLAAGEMKKIGLKNVVMDRFGYVMASLPSNAAHKVPVIGFLAHLDTSPEVSGENVRPQVHKNYNGKDIVISRKDKIVLSPKTCPQLLECAGHDIITASGGTLLGADNKAGIAIVLTAMEWLIKNPGVKRGAVKIALTPDEEIGRGVDNFNVKKFGAEYAYTVDGDVAGVVEKETFNADSVAIKIKGRNYHPGLAKNLMLNAVRIAADIMSSWPENMLPETTERREGYVLFLTCSAAVEEAALKGIVREHDLGKLKKLERHLEAIVAAKKLKYPGAEIHVEFKKQYRNMKEVIDKRPEVMEHLLSAIKSQGLEPKIKPVRGGTDGARLSFMGLPTPNIFTGGYNFHGKYEWVSLDGMEKSCRTLVALAQEWEKNSGKL
ncbi:MAG: peptidase T [Elusimicrobia bacterium]|nr:peptidase T [Elusimicrobiota bacterium]